MNTVYSIVFVILFSNLNFAQRHQINLSPDYSIVWEITPNNQSILFQAEVNSTGFICLGINKPGGNIATDLFVAGYGSNGDYYYWDYYRTTDSSQYEVDLVQNWFMSVAWETGSKTILLHDRLINTGDADHDLNIADETLNLVWAFGMSDEINFDNALWGQTAINLFNPDASVTPTMSTTLNPSTFLTTMSGLPATSTPATTMTTSTPATTTSRMTTVSTESTLPTAITTTTVTATNPTTFAPTSISLPTTDTPKIPSSTPIFTTTPQTTTSTTTVATITTTCEPSIYLICSLATPILIHKLVFLGSVILVLLSW